MQQQRKRGQVKFFDETKGFGFIVQEDNQKDIFFHISETKGKQPQQGNQVEYEVGEGKKGPCGCNVVVL